MKILPKLILASQSPRRKALLRQAGLNFRVIKPDVVEPEPPKRLDPRRPDTFMADISRLKAGSVHAIRHPFVAIAADTLVFYRNKALGKPKNKAEARKMLMQLNGNTHSVTTAVTVNYSEYPGRVNGKTRLFRSKVTFKKMSRDEIDWYLSTGESLDKAGAYGIQDSGLVFVKKVSGSYSNVVGLPLDQTLEMISTVSGISWVQWTKHN